MDSLQPQEDTARLIRDTPLVLLQFGSETCAPCTAIRQKVDLWAADHPQVVCRYVPIEAFPKFAADQGIFSVPTLVVYVQGKPSLRESGYFGLEDFLAGLERLMVLMA